MERRRSSLYRDPHQATFLAASERSARIAGCGSRVSDGLIVGRPKRFVNTASPGDRTCSFLVQVPNPELAARGLDVGDVLPIAGDEDCGVNIGVASLRELGGSKGKLDGPWRGGLGRVTVRAPERPSSSGRQSRAALRLRPTATWHAGLRAARGPRAAGRNPQCGAVAAPDLSPGNAAATLVLSRAPSSNRVRRLPPRPERR